MARFPRNPDVLMKERVAVICLPTDSGEMKGKWCKKMALAYAKQV